MIVAVESNFVLELALRQKEVGACRQMLELSGRGAIQLVIPACALFEPYETLIRRKNQRNRLSHRLQTEGLQLARTESHLELSRLLATATDSLLGVGEEQATSLARAIKNIVPVSTIIPLDDRVIQCADEMGARYNLDPQDSYVLASIDRFLASQGGAPAIFVNKNTRHFDVGALKPWLKAHDCKFFASFSRALAFLDATLCDQLPLE